MPRISMAGVSYFRAEPETIVRFAAENGFEGAEIYAGFPQAYFEDVDAQRRRLIRAIAEKASLSLSVHSPIMGPNIASLNRGIRAESIRQMVGTVDLAADVGARIVVVHNGMRESPFPEAAELQRPLNAQALREIAAHAERQGVRIGLENVCFEAGCLDRSYEDMEKIRLEVGSEALKFTFDFGHARLCGSIEQGLDLLGPNVVHVHLTDNLGQKDDHIELGTGNFDHAPFVGFLGSLNGMIVLEVIDPNETGLGKAVRSLAHARRLLGRA